MSGAGWGEPAVRGPEGEESSEEQGLVTSQGSPGQRQKTAPCSLAAVKASAFVLRLASKGKPRFPISQEKPEDPDLHVSFSQSLKCTLQPPRWSLPCSQNLSPVPVAPTPGLAPSPSQTWELQALHQ